ncbi:MAG: glycosyltransferase family 4 protein [Alphaproteobacteria bacterium]|nr:glycosyltransferase family 4 protein [Alphaproteobacteria bacterium]
MRGTWLGAGDAVIAGVIVIATGVVCAATTTALIPLLRKRNVLDLPNDRSSHAAPTPRGAGIAVIGTVLLAWLALAVAGRVDSAIGVVCLAAGSLAAVCWIDDLYGLSPAIRLAAQAAAVAVGLLSIPHTQNGLAGWLGPTAYDAATGVLWLWWVNAFNFMDGIDGIAGSEAAAIAGGVLLLSAVGSGLDPSLVPLAAALLGASLGFLRWNWSPARIFLGDVGSAPLGYLTGFLLIGLAGAGRWKAALILPLYFLADTSITLGRRLLRGEKIWQAHRQHFYQQAIRRGLGHAAVVRRVIIADSLLVVCGWAAENGGGIFALAAAVSVVAVLLMTLALGPVGARPPGL